MNLRKYTINEFIEEYKKELVSFDTLFYKQIIEKISGDYIILQQYGLMVKYEEAIRDSILTLQLTDEEVNKYFYNPKLLSYDLYGTTELWFLLLHANELHSTTQFNKNPLKVYSGEILNKINSVLNLEKPIININSEEIYERIAYIESHSALI